MEASGTILIHSCQWDKGKMVHCDLERLCKMSSSPTEDVDLALSQVSEGSDSPWAYYSKGEVLQFLSYKPFRSKLQSCTEPPPEAVVVQMKSKRVPIC